MHRLTALSAALVSLTFGAVGGSAVTVTVYTDKAEWENALRGQFLTEGFADEQLNVGVSFVSTESGHINPTQEVYQDVLASQSQNEPMTTWSFAPQITAYGGNWVLGGPGGSGNSLLVYIADFSLYVGAIPNSYYGGFWGFISDTPFTAVRLIGGRGTNQQNYSLDDMVYSPVPQNADFDADGDVDLADFTVFQACFNGPNRPSAGGCAVDADFDDDDDVDLADFTVFQACFNGPNQPPACH